MNNEMKNNGASALTYEFPPVGSSTLLQEKIAELVASRLAENDGVSLEEAGFLGSTVMTDRGGNKVYVKLVFHPKLITEKIPNNYGNADSYRLSPILNRLSNYMFVGEPTSPYVSKFEKCTVPKHHLETHRVTKVDENGETKQVDRAILVFDYDKRGKVTNKTVEMNCVVLSCNPDITFAALVDTNVFENKFTYTATPVKRQAKSERRLAGDALGLVPAHLVITRSTRDDLSYDANEAIPYLRQLAEKRKEAEKAAKDLQKKARKDAEDKPKKVKSAKNKRDKDVDAYRRFMNM